MSAILRILCVIILVGISFSQTKFLSRKSTEIPESFLKNLQSEYRKVISLNGEWQLNSEDFKLSRKVNVPFCYDGKGKVSCSRTFDVTDENINRWNYLLVCDGINYQSEISINGKFVVKHEGGFNSFTSLIGEGVVRESDNEIEVKIDNVLDNSSSLPLKDNPFYPKNYGGIYRDIYIIAVPKIFTKHVRIKSETDINFSSDVLNTISISTTELNYSGTDKKFFVKSELYDSSGNLKAASELVSFIPQANSTSNAVCRIFIAAPQFWSPDSPFFYTVKVTIYHGTDIVDVYQTNIGLHDLRIKNNSMNLNGADFRMKGVNYIEESGEYGMAISYDELEQDVRNIKSLGCNMIKTLGRTPSPLLLYLCSKYGLAVFSEIPVMNVPGSILTSENFQQSSENSLTEMINGIRNEPCIFAYGLGNDFDVSSSEGKEYVEKLSIIAKKSDSKPVYYSTRIYKNDICRELVDFAGINIYETDQKTFKEMTLEFKSRKDRLFISNYGKQINPWNKSGYSDPASLESQSKFIVDFQKNLRSSQMLGSFFTSYCDYNTDFPMLKHFDRTNQSGMTTGLYSIYRELRSPAMILRKHFMEEDIPNLNIGNYSKDFPVVFIVFGLTMFMLFIYLANSVRRFRENVWRALFRPFIFFTDVREQNLVPPYLNIILAVILSFGNALFFANLFSYWSELPYLDIVLSVIVPSPSVKFFLDSVLSNPLSATLFLSVLGFIKIFLISIVLWLFSLTIKFRISFNKIYTVAAWGMLPTIILLLIGTFYIRILNENPDFVYIGLIIAGLSYLVSFYRLIKGTYIIFDTIFIKAYVCGILTLIIVYGGIFFYLNSSVHFIDYVKLVLTFTKG